MSFFRTGLPRVIRGSAIQQPSAEVSGEFNGALSPANARLGEHADAQTPTHWLRLKNTTAGGGNNLRVYFDKPTTTQVFDKQFVTLVPGEVLEGAFELRGLWLYGVGGAATFEGVLGQRVT